jgi:hypothetical protein
MYVWCRFARQPKLSFSYQSQIDEAVVGEDTDSYPHHRASLYGAQPAAGTSINAADDETDEDGASGHGPGAPRNHLSGLHNWLHWHGVFVGVPEVKTGGSPRLPVARSTPSPLMRNDERH